MKFMKKNIIQLRITLIYCLVIACFSGSAGVNYQFFFNNSGWFINNYLMNVTYNSEQNIAFSSIFYSNETSGLNVDMGGIESYSFLFGTDLSPEPVYTNFSSTSKNILMKNLKVSIAFFYSIYWSENPSNIIYGKGYGGLLYNVSNNLTFFEDVSGMNFSNKIDLILLSSKFVINNMSDFNVLQGLSEAFSNKQEPIQQSLQQNLQLRSDVWLQSFLSTISNYNIYSFNNELVAVNTFVSLFSLGNTYGIYNVSLTYNNQSASAGVMDAFYDEEGVICQIQVSTSIIQDLLQIYSQGSQSNFLMNTRLYGADALVFDFKIGDLLSLNSTYALQFGPVTEGIDLNCNMVDSNRADSNFGYSVNLDLNFIIINAGWQCNITTKSSEFMGSIYIPLKLWTRLLTSFDFGFYLYVEDIEVNGQSDLTQLGVAPNSTQQEIGDLIIKQTALDLFANKPMQSYLNAVPILDLFVCPHQVQNTTIITNNSILITFTCP